MNTIIIFLSNVIGCYSINHSNIIKNVLSMHKTLMLKDNKSMCKKLSYHIRISCLLGFERAAAAEKSLIHGFDLLNIVS